MTVIDPQVQADEPGHDAFSPSTAPRPRKARPWLRWVIVAVALLVGIGAGVGIGMAAASSNPKQSNEYRALQASYSAAREHEEGAREQVVAAQQSADSAVAAAKQSLTDREAAAAASEAALSASAAALASQVQVVQQNTISEGVWTVGTDIQPGTYRTTSDVTGDCYWEITKAGSNGDIVQNDIPTGGRPSVTLRVGQDFKTQGCGSWAKQ